jgi:hypothetical protein
LKATGDAEALAAYAEALNRLFALSEAEAAASADDRRVERFARNRPRPVR